MFKNASENQTDYSYHLEKVLYKSNNNDEPDFTIYTLVFNSKVYLIDERNKECFYLLKKNNVGGPSIVFHRYHEKDVTTITTVKRKDNKYIVEDTNKIVKKIIGFDANALYLYSLMQEMPTSYLRHEIFEDDNNIDINHLLDTTYGFYEVDITVQDKDFDKFLEFPPIFKNCTLKDKSRKLISVMSATKILLYHPLLKWYIEHGLIVTKTYSMIHSMNCEIFKEFGELVSDERRKGDIDEDYKIIVDEIKNTGNSGYGRTSLN